MAGKRVAKTVKAIEKQMNDPVLYSFRRCPYAIRARLALRASGIRVAIREVVLADKPAALRQLSVRATVPVLVVNQTEVIGESLDIMLWALQQCDPQGWLPADALLMAESRQLIAANDGEFKQSLDRYKYADRFPEQPQALYRAEAERFLALLEKRLAHSPYLLCERLTLADMAIFPFIRQFANVESDWFEQSPYPQLRRWLASLLRSPLFASVMVKYVPWREGDPAVIC